VANWCRIGLRRATIVPGQEKEGSAYHGLVRSAPQLRGRDLGLDVSPRDRERIDQLCMTSLAGVVAQRKFAPASVRSWHGSADALRAFDLVNCLVFSMEQAEAYLAYLEVATRDLLEIPHVWRSVKAVAEALLAENTLGRARLKELLDKAQQDTIAEALARRPGVT
jgi:hypothetical protein